MAVLGGKERGIGEEGGRESEKEEREEEGERERRGGAHRRFSSVFYPRRAARTSCIAPYASSVPRSA
eukprot:3941450-Rhodomonas_salina.1